jgi:hypothetical protein
MKRGVACAVAAAAVAVCAAAKAGGPAMVLETDKTTYERNDSITLHVTNFGGAGVPNWPFVRIGREGGPEVLYLTQKRGFVRGPTPYLGFEAGPVDLPRIENYPLLRNARFRGMPADTYILEGGLVDISTTDINDLKYLGVSDPVELRVE